MEDEIPLLSQEQSLSDNQCDQVEVVVVDEQDELLLPQSHQALQPLQPLQHNQQSLLQHQPLLQLPLLPLPHQQTQPPQQSPSFQLSLSQLLQESIRVIKTSTLLSLLSLTISVLR